MKGIHQELQSYAYVLPLFNYSTLFKTKLNIFYFGRTNPSSVDPSEVCERIQDLLDDLWFVFYVSFEIQLPPNLQCGYQNLGHQDAYHPQ